MVRRWLTLQLSCTYKPQYVDWLAWLSFRSMLPEDGCPGPVEVHLSDNIVLVIMDSQWWLHLNPKPGPQSECPCKTKDEIITRLNDIVYRNQDKLLLFATHHPMKSYGVHGGYFTLKQHLFPLTDIKPSLYIPLPVVELQSQSCYHMHKLAVQSVV